MNAQHLTVRNVPPQLAAALDAERRRRGTSLNQTVLDLLSQSLAVKCQRSNGLRRFAGTWSEEEFREFEENTRVFEEIDRELWR
jgi:hypothetical protein